MKNLPAVALVIAASTLAVAHADEPAPKGDLARLQGKWSAKVGPEKNIPITVAIEGTKVTLTLPTPDGAEIDLKGELRLDEDAKPHKTIDWIKFKDAEGEEVPENHGIYQIEGDTLTTCSGGPGNPRPTEFKAGEDGHPHLVTLTRVK